MSQKIIKELKKIVGADNADENVSMSQYTTFNVGGPADYIIMPENNEQIKNVITFLRENIIKYYIIGNGSNILVNDKGYRGAIIRLNDNFADCRIDDGTVRAMAGIKLKNLAEILCDNSLTGFEFASGIPGTLGGAVSMNAGAYGGEMKDVIVSAKVMNQEGEIVELSLENLNLGYRTSKIVTDNYILLEALLKLENGNKNEIRAKMEDLSTRRHEKQPLEFPSAGSTFKRPEGYFAGKLIMDSGLAGYRSGNAMVSKKHCGFVINAGGATSEDVCNVINHVIETVDRKFGVRLEPEVKIL